MIYSNSSQIFIRIIPDFRRTMYCYGVRQDPGGAALVYSLYRYSTDEANYFNRDGDNLLHAMSCQNDTKKLNEYVILILLELALFFLSSPLRYIRSSLSGELPMNMLSYIAENDPTGGALYGYFQKNILEVGQFITMTSLGISLVGPNLLQVLQSVVDFDYFVEVMTTDWSSKEQLNQVRQMTNGFHKNPHRNAALIVDSLQNYG